MYVWVGPITNKDGSGAENERNGRARQIKKTESSPTRDTKKSKTKKVCECDVQCVSHPRAYFTLYYLQTKNPIK